MSLGPVVLDIEGQELSREDRELLRHPAVGGVILFTRNYGSPEQLEVLVQAIHRLREPPLAVCVDQEGGRVQRFVDGFTRLPPVRDLGVEYDQNAGNARELARITGWLMAAELRAVGVDFSFAPVLDLDRGISSVIGDRAFHWNPDVVTELAHAYMGGMHEAGMAATGKHFPGHGGVQADSHRELPMDLRGLEDLWLEDLIPFERMIRFSLAGIMPAHLVFPNVDGQPAGFSRIWLQEILRKWLGFQGVIFSDDLNMAAAQAGGDYGDRARCAVAAGCDMVLICNNRLGAIKVIEALARWQDPAAALRRVRLHGRPALGRVKLHTSSAWKTAVARIEPYAQRASLDLDLF